MVSKFGRKGRLPKHGRRLSICEDFTLSAEKVGDYHTGSRRVLTSILGVKADPDLCDFCRKRKRYKETVFQRHFSHTVTDLLCLAGKGAIEPHRKGIEMMVNLINISYCAMKILPYREGKFSQYRDVSVQEFRFALSEQVRRQVFYVNLVQNIVYLVTMCSHINNQLSYIAAYSVFQLYNIFTKFLFIINSIIDVLH